MLDINLILSDFMYVKDKLLAKKVESSKLDELYNLAATYKNTLKNLESARGEQNAKSKLFFEYKKDGKDISSLQDELATIKKNIAKLEDEFSSISASMNKLLLEIPNLIDSRTPLGNDEKDNKVLEYILEPKKFDFKPKEHWEIAQDNKWIDFEVAVKLAKSRFSLLRGGGAKLNRALINFMLEHNSSYGFEEISTPVIVNADSMITTGQLPKFEEDMFKIASFIDTSTEVKDKGYKEKGHELYLISTAEISLTNMYRDCIIPLDDLPIKLCAYTPCFRKEAGSAGRDTRGMIRQHQFDKVELVAITKQNESEAMQDLMIECASGILKKLEIPHRLVQLCSGDLGFSASNTVDIEVWLPGQNCYREISSVSNVRDFQARRGKIRYKDGKKNILAHTLNGSSLAVGRTFVAVMENYQLSNGDIEIPKVLKKYLA